MSRHIKLGKTGEQAARLFLEHKGHIVLEVNYRFEHKEIDLISLCGNIVVFTEIKARSSYDFGFPEEAVTVRKQQLLKQAAEHYCLLHPEYTMMRFDVVSILMDGLKAADILHFEDAFY